MRFRFFSPPPLLFSTTKNHTATVGYSWTLSSARLHQALFVSASAVAPLQFASHASGHLQSPGGWRISTPLSMESWHWHCVGNGNFFRKMLETKKFEQFEGTWFQFPFLILLSFCPNPFAKDKCSSPRTSGPATPSARSCGLLCLKHFNVSNASQKRSSCYSSWISWIRTWLQGVGWSHWSYEGWFQGEDFLFIYVYLA